MANLTIRCQCGDMFHVGNDAVGRRIKCRKCGHVTEVRKRRKPLKVRVGQWMQSASTRVARYARARLDRRARQWRHRPPLSRFATLLTYATYAYLAFTCAIAIAMWTIGDVTWFGTLLIFIGRWIFLLPLLFLVPAALLRRRTLLWPLIAAALITLGPTMGIRTGWRTWLPSPDGIPVRVVTFNAERGDILSLSLPTVLSEWNADIIALQECGELLRQSVSKLTSWNHHEEHGICLITKYPIDRVDVFDRAAFAHLEEFGRNQIGGSADITRYRLQTSGGPIDVTTVHLETPRKGLEGFVQGGSEPSVERLRLNTELRDIESSVARNWVDRGDAPSLVLGDFNMPVESRIFQRHWGDLTDAFSYAGRGFGMTKDNGWIQVRIDHILFGPGWHANRARVEQSAYSDHRPVIADLILERP